MKNSFCPSLELVYTLLISSVPLLKLYFRQQYGELNGHAIVCILYSTTKFSVLRIHLGLKGSATLLNVNGICESSSDRLRFMKAPSQQKIPS